MNTRQQEIVSKLTELFNNVPMSDDEVNSIGYPIEIKLAKFDLTELEVELAKAEAGLVIAESMEASRDPKFAPYVRRYKFNPNPKFAEYIERMNQKRKYE